MPPTLLELTCASATGTNVTVVGAPAGIVRLTVAGAEVFVPSLTVNVNESAPVWPAFGVYVMDARSVLGVPGVHARALGALRVPLEVVLGVLKVRVQSSASVPARLNVIGLPTVVDWLLPLAVGVALVTVRVTVAETGGFVPSLTV